jgi:hypothetical protein
LIEKFRAVFDFEISNAIGIAIEMLSRSKRGLIETSGDPPVTLIFDEIRMEFEKIST